MARVFFIDPIDHIEGKICSHNHTIYMKRKEINKNGERIAYTSRICHKHNTDPKPATIAVRNRFKAVQAAVRNRMKNGSQVIADNAAFSKQTRFKTMRAFLWDAEGKTYDTQQG